MRVRVKVGTGPITWTILNDHTLSSCGMYAEELMFYLVIGVLLDSGIQYIELSLHYFVCTGCDFRLPALL